MDFGTSLRRILSGPKKRQEKRKERSQGRKSVDSRDSSVSTSISPPPHVLRPQAKHIISAANTTTTTATAATIATSSDTLSNIDKVFSNSNLDIAGSAFSSPEPSPLDLDSSVAAIPTGSTFPAAGLQSSAHTHILQEASSPTADIPACPAVLLQDPSPPPRDQNDPIAHVLDTHGHHTLSTYSSPHRARRDQGPIIDIQPLESAAVSASSLPLLATDAAAPEQSHCTSKDIPDTSVLQERSHSHTATVRAQPGADNAQLPTMNHSTMRRVWVKRPGASATMVAIRPDDLVDDVRDKVLQKYANSLGRSYDAPDVVIRIISRSEESRQLAPDRMLGPEEDICGVLDSYYPTGQTVTEALLIEIPAKRTPKPSPRHHHSHSNASYQALDEFRPHESGTDYFPPMPPTIIHGTNGQTAVTHDPRALAGVLRLPPDHTRSISVLQTGQVPPLPSPGASSRRQRPKYGRQHTSSPTVLAHAPGNAGTVVVSSPGPGANLHLPVRGPRPRGNSSIGDRPTSIPAPPPLPTPPAPEAPPTGKGSPPPTPMGRDLHRANKTRKIRKATPTNGATPKAAAPTAQASMLDGSVPPINVLIVEDNIINLKLLEAFMKRLKVRWSTAMNGQIAVKKWRTGGFHLVLMDIQLPIMNGLEATKEIRRLERVNGIGIFSDGAGESEAGADASKDAASPAKDSSKDKLKMEEGLFKSPVIIVALTASSLQSDRHEALAAGCNDFLTKPVNFVWLERKVKEWGCMQALIDFDGWRKWKDFSGNATDKSNGKAIAAAPAKPSALAKSPELEKKKRDKRTSADVTGFSAEAKAALVEG